ncbi:hypothetical protein CKO28_17530 [Rhodovibrio sodomensis]|uniref:Uncharacterized protein n=1 Tax=Rhodovibrio sodomensis TaxID=1088 RepID=A0ABS1DH89_9PROT|nr:hypothetical protein [Rhodovibrio sodomensis]MBK1669840.1 hypothetical protein [Rhodovibrio sodomensis]
MSEAEIEVECWEPCEWHVAFGHVDPLDFIAALRRELFIDTSHEIDEGDVRHIHVRELTPSEKAEGEPEEPVWTSCEPDHAGAVPVTVVEF